ncbi:MAG TPA: NADH-quinone oxidoreductase subunit NuoB, partial [Ktedonobacteraceae bacterium]|nr:NADH-quinone oxidoreductase subunit NuoB [Ktedonobacteraceae bacterium]
MSNEKQHEEQERIPKTRRKAIPLSMARGPQDYLPGQQEEPAVVTSVADMLQWAQNWARSRSIWPFMYALACCGFEMIAAASAPQYDMARFGSEVFRASPRQADLMIVAGTVSVKMAPRLRHLWEQMPEPKWVISMGQCANSGGEFYDSDYTAQGVDTVVPVDVYVPGCPPRPEALIEGILKLREKIEKQGYITRIDENSSQEDSLVQPVEETSDAEVRTAPGRHTQEMLLNLGPQHPSTHGVLRLILTIEGETVVKAVPDIGFLHTGIEKTAEAKTYHQALVLTDRMDYLAPLCNNLGYSLAVEKLLGIEDEINDKIRYVRVLLAELQRIASHLVWLGTSALDLGAMSVFLYCFREREMILDVFEELSGVRMMTSYICPGGLQADLTPA